jgi:hypothetical protein
MHLTLELTQCALTDAYKRIVIDLYYIQTRKNLTFKINDVIFRTIMISIM